MAEQSIRLLKRKNILKMATWNCRQALTPEKELYLCSRMQELGLNMVGLQEVGWRYDKKNPDHEIMHDGVTYSLLYSGPSDTRAIPRSKGVGLLLDPTTRACLKEVKLRTDRILVAEFHGILPLHVIVIYAPHSSHLAATRTKFYEDLDAVINRIPSREPVIIIGDFNATVGSAAQSGDGDTFTGILGKWGVGTLDNTGKLLLELCAARDLCVATTLFRHKAIHKHTHKFQVTDNSQRAIDHILIRRKFISGAQDVRVYRQGNLAYDLSDHQLVVMKYRLRLKEYKTKKITSIQSLNDSTLQQQYAALVSTKLAASSVDQDIANGNLEQAWTTLAEVLSTSAAEVLPEITISWPSSPTPGTPELVNLMAERSMLKESLARNKRKKQTGDTSIRCHRLITELGRVKKELRAEAVRAKRQHLTEVGQRLAAADEAGQQSDKWQLFNDITQRRRGSSSSSKTGLRDENGALLTCPVQQCHRLARFMTTLYNSGQHVDAAALSTIPPSTSLEADIPLTNEDYAKALNKLKRNKAADSLGLTAEHLHFAGSDVSSTLFNLCQKVMQHGLPPTAKLSDLVALPKGNDQELCENKRPIQLISMLRKLLSTWLNSKLTPINETFLSDYQSGFRPNRGCLDNLFILRTLCEEATTRVLPEGKQLHLIFVDLKKAFDKVDRSALIAALEHHGIPSNLVALAQDMHTNTSASVRWQGKRATPFQIDWGVQQGCPASCPLFNIFMDLISRDISALLGPDVGVEIKYVIDGQVHKTPSNTNYRHCKRVVQLLLADDLTLIADNESDTRALLGILDVVTRKWSMEVNTLKTKILIIGSEADSTAQERPPFILGTTVIEVVQEQKYLGSILSSSGSLDKEISYRISQAAAALNGLKPLFSLPDDVVSPQLKGQFYMSLVVSRLLYGAETWAARKQREVQRLQVLHCSALRSITGRTRWDRVRNEVLYEKIGVPSIQSLLRNCRLRYLGQLGRMDDSRLAKQVLHCKIDAPKRSGNLLTLRSLLAQDVLKLLGEEGQPVGRRWDRRCQNYDGWKASLRRLLEESRLEEE